MELGLKDKTAIVSASSSGLGKAIAMELCREGARVMLFSPFEEQLKEAQAEIEEKTGNRPEYEAGDITKAEDIKRLVKTTTEKLGPVYALMNNTGGPSPGKMCIRDSCEAALNDTLLCEAVRYGNRLWVVPVQKTKELAKRKGSFGTFYEYGIKELEELIPAVNKKIQTMTCYGYDIQKLRRFVRDSRPVSYTHLDVYKRQSQD